MRMRIFAIACCTAGLMFACFSSCSTKPLTALNEGQLSQYVGSIQGHCCKPGQRYGCAVANFSTLPITCSKNTTTWLWIAPVRRAKMLRPATPVITRPDWWDETGANSPRQIVVLNKNALRLMYRFGVRRIRAATGFVGT